MAGTVAEIMDPQFFRASQTDSIGQVLQDMAKLGLGSAPVVDGGGHPVGMATLREIDGCRRMGDLSEHLQHPVVSVHQNTSIDAAARTLAEHEAECLVLVDDHGVAVGAVRAHDLLCAVLGLRLSHSEKEDVPRPPENWSRGALLSLESVGQAPALPGLILLDPGGPSVRPNIVWVEAAANIRERLDDMLLKPQDEPALEQLLAPYPRRVLFHSLVVTDPERQERLLRSLRAVLAQRLAKAGDASAVEQH
ncbi:MAG TPA: CBS domain-containing protein [Polyangiaceae bacterium]|nr:CBS domain-containing protein [Polyangiaceae bacterium]